MTKAITELDLRVIDRVLSKEAGYILDFSDRTFAAFFTDFSVDITAAKYCSEGTSKAKRLRGFLRVEQPPLTGRVLAELLQHRLLSAWEPLTQEERAAFEAIVRRHGGATEAQPERPPTEDALFKLDFRPDVFARLPVDAATGALLVARMEEARRCVDSQAYLAAVILAGSVLEGMCLGYGTRNIEAANRAYAAQFSKAAPAFHAWKLAEWIEVLARLRALSQNVVKFGHALRDFRNYIHPSEQLARGFVPDKHTARIAFHVVIAAADDLIKASAG
jgi:hypothetical protein